MSIQGALNTALSSLTVLSQQTSLISNNIANASTPGYQQQDLTTTELRGNGAGAGVVAGRVRCLANQVASSAANQAAGAQAYSQQMVAVLTPYMRELGQASDDSSLTSRLSALENSLTNLSVTPNDGTTQNEVVNDAQSLAQTFQGLSGAISTARQDADAGIADAVTVVNDTLDKLQRNEASRMLAIGEDRPTATYDTERNRLLGDLSQNLPIKVHYNGREGISIATDQGTTLWDGKVHHLSFTATPSIPATMRATPDADRGLTGGLSDVTVDGQKIAVSQSGTIAANLKLRDETLTGFSDQLDRLAGNLVASFQQSDATVGAGQAGLFTDGGNALDAADPAAVAGLAGRIEVNPRVDPQQGGQAWRVRDGVQANSQGPVGNNAAIISMIDHLHSAASASAVAGLPASTSLGDAASQVAGLQQSTLSTWDSLNTSRTQQAQEAKAALASSTGVNIDEQLQRLLIVQQTYAASSQVIRAASSMMDSLLSAVG